MSGRWHDVADENAVSEGAMLAAVAGGLPIVLLRREGRLRAFEDACPHLEYPLSTGVVDGAEIVCSWHGAAFDIASGAVICGPASRPLRPLAVRIIGGRVEVAWPAPDR